MTVAIMPKLLTTMLPLVVDLDDTLLQTDTLLESLVETGFKMPKRLPNVIRALSRGRAAFKEAAIVDIDPKTLPYNKAVLNLIETHRQLGGAVHLVTAASQRVAERIAAHLEIFDSVVGSDGVVNNKGATKADALAARFPDGFAYLGDCEADVPVWKAATQVIVIHPSTRLQRALARADIEVDQIIYRQQPTLRTWVHAFRLHQWFKNILVFVPLFLSQTFANPLMVSRSCAMFLLFGIIASSTYVFNDLGDLVADRRHPTKKNRPLAAGVLSIRIAFPVALLMLTGGLTATLFLSLKTAGVAATYVVVTLWYTFSLKTVPIVDTITIGALFCLRVVAGMVVLYQPISIWLSTLALVLFTSLALAKRNAELVRAAAAGRHVVGRGYLDSDLLLTTSVGIACGVTAVLVMVIYMASEAERIGLYAHVPPLFLIPLILFLWIMRIWVRAHRGSLHDDPVEFAIRDPVSWAFAAAVVVFWIAGVYL